MAHLANKCSIKISTPITLTNLSCSLIALPGVPYGADMSMFILGNTTSQMLNPDGVITEAKVVDSGVSYTHIYNNGAAPTQSFAEYLMAVSAGNVYSKYMFGRFVVPDSLQLVAPAAPAVPITILALRTAPYDQALISGNGLALSVLAKVKEHSIGVSTDLLDSTTYEDHWKQNTPGYKEVSWTIKQLYDITSQEALETLLESGGKIVLEYKSPGPAQSLYKRALVFLESSQQSGSVTDMESIDWTFKLGENLRKQYCSYYG